MKCKTRALYGIMSSLKEPYILWEKSPTFYGKSSILNEKWALLEWRPLFSENNPTIYKKTHEECDSKQEHAILSVHKP